MYREDIILPVIKGKKVLDCGGVDHNFLDNKIAQGDWLHSLIAKHAASCLGVDILDESVNKLNSTTSFKFLTANVESLGFDQEFEVVVAGEIIEHIYNAGLFLDSVWRALQTDGLLVITTPNAYGASFAFQSWFRGREKCHEEHTCYYSKQTLAYIVERHGFSVKSLVVLQRPAKTAVRRLVRKVQHAIRPNNSETLVLVAQKTSLQKKYDDKW